VSPQTQLAIAKAAKQLIETHPNAYRDEARDNQIPPLDLVRYELNASVDAISRTNDVKYILTYLHQFRTRLDYAIHRLEQHTNTKPD